MIAIILERMGLLPKDKKDKPKKKGGKK